MFLAISYFTEMLHKGRDGTCPIPFYDISRRLIMLTILTKLTPEKEEIKREANGRIHKKMQKTKPKTQ